MFIMIFKEKKRGRKRRELERGIGECYREGKGCEEREGMFEKGGMSGAPQNGLARLLETNQN